MFPMNKLIDVMINDEPFAVNTESDFIVCMSKCLANTYCVAISFDNITKSCYLLNSTRGYYIKVKNYVSVLFNQPKGLIHNWVYNRNTIIEGNYLESVNSDDFLSCLDMCDKTILCDSLNYDLSTRMCNLIQFVNNQYEINLKYGVISVFHLNLMHQKDSSYGWRFSKEEDSETVQKTNKAESESQRI